MKKVLIVDDEALSRRSLKESILWENYGYCICGEANNGQAALALTEKLLPEVVFTDIKMPVMDGLEFLQKMNEKGIRSKIIVLSCYDEFNFVREAMRLGTVDYLLKHTYEEADLISLLKKLDKLFEKESTTSESVESLRQDVFLKILKNELQEKDIQKYMDREVLPPIKSYYMIAYFKLSISETKDTAGLFRQTLRQLLGHSALENKIDSFFIFKESENIYSILFLLNGAAGVSEQKESLKKIMGCIYQQLEEQEIGWLSGISYHAYNEWKYLKEAYQEAKEMIGEETKFLNCSAKVLSAIEYIKGNYYKPINLEDISEYAGISRIYLSQIFKKETNINISDFLIQYRLKQAEKLLLTSNLKVYTIAELCGFRSVQYFSQTFKKITGFSPYDFKDKNK